MIKSIFEDCWRRFSDETGAKKRPNLIIQHSDRFFGKYTRSTNTITINPFIKTVSKKHLMSTIYHELCHTIEFNHGEKFKKLLRKFSPNYEKLSYEASEAFNEKYG